MRRCLLILWGLLLAGSCFGWGEDIARIDVSLSDRKGVLAKTDISAGGRMDYFSWEPDGGRWGMSVNLPAKKDYQEGFFKITPSADGILRLAFMGPDIKEGGKRVKIEMEYQTCEVDGKVLFDTPFAAWHDQGKPFTVPVKKDTPYLFKVTYRQKPGSIANNVDYPLDFSKTANMGYADEKANDGKGGWTDQGDQDMRNFNAKITDLYGIKMKFIDPAQNGGNAVMTFASSAISPEIKLGNAEINVPGELGGFRYLYVVHSLAWAMGKPGKVGSVTVNFADGTVKTFEVKEFSEVRDWIEPGNQPNGLVVGRCTASGRPAGLYFSRFVLDDGAKQVKSIVFSGLGQQPVWVVAGAALSNTFVDTDKLFQAGGPLTITAGKEFKAIDMTDLNIRPGSALDLSFLLDQGQIDGSKRLTISDGRFVLAADPAKRVRFTGCSINFRTDLINLDKKGIEEYVALAKRQGFNMFRAHYLDAFLMWMAKADGEFNPDYLDRFQYLIYCMKKENMYLSLDAMSASSGYRKLSGWWYNGPDLKKQIFWDPAVREEWRLGTQKVLTAVNPYTKTALVDDPVLVNVVLFNEQDIGLVFNDISVFDHVWHQFLLKKYGSESQVLAAYGNAFKQISEIKINSGGSSQLGKDSRQFMFDLYQEMNDWYVKTIRDIGYKGYLSQLDCDPKLRFTLQRNDFEVVSMHSYHAHPDKYISEGSKLAQTSAAETSVGYLTGIGAARLLDRPFMITEILQVFWNKYRFEQGLMLGAYCAYQDYDCVIPHSGPVMFAGSGKLNPFGVGSDPIARASDLLTNFLFLSKNIAPAPRTVEFQINAANMVGSGVSESYMSRALRDAMLITRVGFTFGDLPRPAGVGPVKSDQVIKVDLDKMSYKDYMDRLNAQIVGRDNPSNIAEGYFVTDTRQIVLDAKKGYFEVVTPGLAGASSMKKLEFELPGFQVSNGSVPGCAAVLSLDRKPLAESSRLLLVITGDALNNNMKFADQERTTLLELGKDPLLQLVKAEINLKNIRGKSVNVYPLKMNGERMPPVAATLGSQWIKFTVDTGALPQGPTVFYEIEVK